MYVLKRTSDGKYVSVSGSKESYTSDIRKAEVFATKAEAIRSSCIENEYPVTVGSQLEGYKPFN